MPAKLNPPTSDSLLLWAATNPAQVIDYLALVRALQNLEIVVTQNNVTKRFPLKVSSENAVIEIKL
jgi:hypothetical protein